LIWAIRTHFYDISYRLLKYLGFLPLPCHVVFVDDDDDDDVQLLIFIVFKMILNFKV